MSECLSCGSSGVERYCPVCGQPVVSSDRSLLPWLRGALSELLALDGRTADTLRLLFTAPGTLTTRWISGERTRNTAPLRLYLASSLIFFGTVSILGADPVPIEIFFGGGGGLSQQSAIRALSEVAPDGLEPDLLRAAAAAYEQVFENFVTIGLLVAAPTTALILQLLLWRARKWFYVDHLVHALHVLSFALIVFAAAWPILFLRLGGLGLAVVPTAVVVSATYGAISFNRVYELGFAKTLIAYPGMLILGFVGATTIFGLVGGGRLAFRVADAALLWDDAYRSYAERVYGRVSGPTPGDRAEQAMPLVTRLYEHAPYQLRRLDPHTVADFADLHILGGDPEGALSVIGSASPGIRNTLDLAGAAAVAHAALGDSARGRARARAFLDLQERGATAMHTERGNRYRVEALEILEDGRTP